MTQPQVEPQPIQMLLTLLPGEPPRLQVQGPIDNKLLCYGMLEMARDAIKDYKPPAIQTAPADLIEQLRKQGGNGNGHRP